MLDRLVAHAIGGVVGLGGSLPFLLTVHVELDTHEHEDSRFEPHPKPQNSLVMISVWNQVSTLEWNLTDPTKNHTPTAVSRTDIPFPRRLMFLSKDFPQTQVQKEN